MIYCSRREDPTENHWFTAANGERTPTSVFYGFSYNRNFSDQNWFWTLFFCLARRRRKFSVYFVSNYKIEVFFRLFFEEIRENMHRVSKFPGNITGNFLSRSRIPGNFRLYNRKKNTALNIDQSLSLYPPQCSRTNIGNAIVIKQI